MTSCETIKPCAYIPSVPMTLDLQRELPLLAQAKVDPSNTHLLASHEASFPSPAKVLYFIIQDFSSIVKCVLPVEIRELRIRIGVIFQKTDNLVEDKGSREMTIGKKKKRNQQILNYPQHTLIEKKGLNSVISGK